MEPSKALEHVSMRLGHRYGFFKAEGSRGEALCDARTFSRFMKAVSSRYNNSHPYHNSLHATDVLLSSNAYLEQSGVLLLRDSCRAISVYVYTRAHVVSK